MISRNSWPERLAVGDINLTLTDSVDAAPAVADLSASGPRADYTVTVGHNTVGWLIAQQGISKSRLYVRVIIEMEREPFSVASLETEAGLRLLRRIAELLKAGRVYDVLVVEVSGSDTVIIDPRVTAKQPERP